MPNDQEWMKVKVSGAAVLVIVFGLLALIGVIVFAGVYLSAEGEVQPSDRNGALTGLVLALISTAVVLLTAVISIRNNVPDPEMRRARLRRVFGGLGALAAAGVLGVFAITLSKNLVVIPSGLFLCGIIAIATALPAPSDGPPDIEL